MPSSQLQPPGMELRKETYTKVNLSIECTEMATESMGIDKIA